MCGYSVLRGGGGGAVTSQLPFNSEARHPHLTSVDWECV